MRKAGAPAAIAPRPRSTLRGAIALLAPLPRSSPRPAARTCEEEEEEEEEEGGQEEEGGSAWTRGTRGRRGGG